MALAEFIRALEAHGLRRTGEGQWVAKCPSHDDRTPSLGLTRGTGGSALIKCRAGCDTKDVVRALGLEMRDLFDPRDEAPKETLPIERWPVTATYTYEDASGDPVFRVLRKTSPDSGNKTFRQERWTSGGWLSGVEGVKKPLYMLPRILEHADAPVFVCEGERDVESLTSLGAVATTNAGGAGKWDELYTATLKGRDVVILPDNDPPGDKHAALVKSALEGIAKSVKVVRLPGVPKKGDATDWIGSGGTLDELRVLVDRADAGARFMPSEDRLVGEQEDRLELGRRLLSFGLKYLDDAFGGITPRDLILIGALTGAGKTQCASNIAMENCERGKQVHYFALEAEDREIERRLKFQFAADAYYQDAQFSTKRIRFIDWYNGRLHEQLGEYERRTETKLRAALKNLHTYYRVESFTTDDFARQLAAIKDHTDLVILDHFHYVDSKDENENRGQKQAIKQIRDCALIADRPVIVAGHIRKSDPRFAPLVPTEEAFHGSSDLVKIATKAIMIAPDYGTDTGSPTVWSTFVRIVKCRQDSSLTRFTAKINFDTRNDGYEDFYLTGKLTDGGREWTALDRAQWPSWHDRWTVRGEENEHGES